MINIIGKRSWFFTISGLVILAGIIALVAFGLKPGIEFSPGSLLTVDFTQEVDEGMVEQALADLGYGDAIVQHTGAGDYLIRLPVLTDTEKSALESGLTASLGQLEVRGFDSVSEMIASETRRNTIIAVE